MGRRPKTRREAQKQAMKKLEESRHKALLKAGAQKIKEEERIKARMEWAEEHGLGDEIGRRGVSGTSWGARWWCLDEMMRVYGHSSLSLHTQAGRFVFATYLTLTGPHRVIRMDRISKENGALVMHGVITSGIFKKPFTCTYEQFFSLPVIKVTREEIKGSL